MGNSEKVKVGIFGARTPEARVPSNMDGNFIWFSPKYNLFMITDQNNQQVASFDFKKFKELLDNEVIIFSSPGVESYMSRLYREWEAEQAMKDPFANFDALDRLAQTDSAYNSNKSVSQQNVKRIPRNRNLAGNIDSEEVLGESAASKQKDPTRRIPVFMALTLIFTLIIIVVLNFATPILQAIAPLLS